MRTEARARVVTLEPPCRLDGRGAGADEVPGNFEGLPGWRRQGFAASPFEGWRDLPVPQYHANACVLMLPAG